MNLLRRSMAAVLCACLVLLSPGIDCYQAFAQFQTQAAANNPNAVYIVIPSAKQNESNTAIIPNPLGSQFILKNGIWAPRRMSDNLLYGPYEHVLLAAPFREHGQILVQPAIQSGNAGFLKAANPPLILPVFILPLTSPFNPNVTNPKPTPIGNSVGVSEYGLQQAARLGELLTSQVDLAEAKNLVARQFGDHLFLTSHHSGSSVVPPI